MKTKLALLFTLCLLACAALPAVLLSNPTSAAGGQLTDWQGKIEKLELGFDWLKWNLAIGFPVLFAGLIGLASLVFFLYTRIDSRIDRLEVNTRQDMQKLDSRIDKMESGTKQDIQRLETNTSQDIKEIRQLLIQLIQKQAGQETSRQDTKQSPAKRQAKR